MTPIFIELPKIVGRTVRIYDECFVSVTSFHGC